MLEKEVRHMRLAQDMERKIRPSGNVVGGIMSLSNPYMSPNPQDITMWPYLEVIKLKCSRESGPISNLAGVLIRGNEDTQRGPGGVCTQRKSYVKTHWEGGCLQAKKRGPRRSQPAETLVLNFESPELWEISLCCLSLQSVVFYYCGKLIHVGLANRGLRRPQHS